MKLKVLYIVRILVGLVFISSGLLKANDPLGTQYKLQDYLEALGMPGLLPEWLTLGCAVLICCFEVYLGANLLFGIKRRKTIPLALAFMSLMTLITLWLAIWNPISDCGCFGEAIHLTNWQSLFKNLVLLALLILLCWKRTEARSMLPAGVRWWCSNLLVIASFALSVYSLCFLPPVDFTPYHIGVNIWHDMQIPSGSPTAKYETTFIMKKDGQTKEFSLEDYPDSSWQFVNSKTRLLSPGYEPPIHDLDIEPLGTSNDSKDLTKDILTYPGYTYILISPHLEQASDANFGKIEQLYEEANDKGYRFICLTASGSSAIAKWQDRTGAEYPFYNTDATTLKTMVRSNPGILLLKGGTIIKKLSHNSL